MSAKLLRARLLDGGYPMVAGHRGSPREAPENTLPSLALAVSQGADMVEIDAQRTRDGVLVLLHDATVDRTTNGHGRLCDMTLAQVKQLDAGSWFSPAYAGTEVPTLREALRALPPSVAINVEVKSYQRVDDGLAAAVLGDLDAEGATGRVIISSTDERVLRQIRELHPGVLRGLIRMRVRSGRAGQAELAGADLLHAHWSFLRARSCRRLRARHLPLAIWTVNGRWTMRRCCALGVSIVITDRPALALAALR